MSYHDKPRPTPSPLYDCITVQGVPYTVCALVDGEIEAIYKNKLRRYYASIWYRRNSVTARTGHYHGWRLKTLKP